MSLKTRMRAAGRGHLLIEPGQEVRVGDKVYVAQTTIFVRNYYRKERDREPGAAGKDGDSGPEVE
jgi:hypothetical protein